MKWGLKVLGIANQACNVRTDYLKSFAVFSV